MLRILVDADSCPVKSEVYRVAQRYQIPVILVANSWMRTPGNQQVSLQLVGAGFDAADDWIVEYLQSDNIVVTADTLLAGRCLKLGATVIAPKGRPFTEDNIGQTIATRDLLAELRGAGEITGGPAPLTQRDRSQFLQQLDNMVQAIRRLDS